MFLGIRKRAFGWALLLALGGCATPGPAPEQILAEAETALAQAEQAEAWADAVRYGRQAFAAQLAVPGASQAALERLEARLLGALAPPSAGSPPGADAADPAFLEELSLLELEAQMLFADDLREDALGTLELALALADDVLGPTSEESLRLGLALGDVAVSLGDLRRAEGLFGAAEQGGAGALQGAAQARLGELYELEGRWAEAAEVSERALAAAADPVAEAALAQSLARRLDQAGRLTEGLAVLQARCDALAEAGHPLLAPVLACREQAVVALARGGQGEAARSALLALQPQRAERFGPESEAVLRGELALANLERQLGLRSAAARRLAALEGAPHFAPGLEAADLREAQARLAFDEGRDEAALSWAEDSLALRSAAYARDHPLVLESQNLLAAITLRQGDRTRAEGAWRQVLAGFEARYGRDSLNTLTVMSNLGVLLEQVGLFDDAEPLLRDALAAARTVLGPTHPQTLTIMNNLGLLLESQGTFDQAEALYLEPLEVLKARGEEGSAQALAVENNLAYLYLLQGAGEAARARFTELYARYTATLGADHPDTLRTLNNRGRAEVLVGDLDAARVSLGDALRGREGRYGPLHRDVIRSLIDLGALAQQAGRFDAAGDQLAEALRRAEAGLGPTHPYTFDALNALAEVRRQQGRLDEAYRLRRAGFERRTGFFQRVLPVTGENAREGYLRLHRPELDAYLSLLAQRPPEEAGRALLEVSLARKGLLLAIASDIAQVAALGLNPELAALTEALAGSRETLARLTLAGPGEGDPSAHLKSLRAEEGRIEDLQRALGRASLRYQRTLSVPSLEALGARLPESGGALVDFLAYRDESGTRQLMASVLRRDGQGALETELVTFPPLDKLEEGIRYYRELIQDEGVGDEELLEEAMFLYEDLWAPVAERVDPSAPIYLVPDGVLHILPFDALADADGRYLLETLDLRILSSARDLMPDSLPRAVAPPLVMAGPDYDTDAVADPEQLAEARSRAARGGSKAPPRRADHDVEGPALSRAAAVLESLRAASDGLRGLSFSPLPGARLEGELIVRRLAQEDQAPRMLTALDAQEAVLGRLDAPPRVLHLATHGFFLAPEEKLRKRLLKAQRSAEMIIPPPGDNPLLRAGLAFAGINENAPFFGELDTRNDGVLTALEVLDLDLTGTELAILSACETGLGEIHEGEGVYGLRRAFQEAGVREVVTSLWEVSDAGTQALMTALYERLAIGMAPREALREAQRELAASPRWGYPYVWAAFMMVSR